MFYLIIRTPDGDVYDFVKDQGKPIAFSSMPEAMQACNDHAMADFIEIIVI